jgi:hypothetical protein
MTRLSSLIILSATAIALSSPALAKTSIQKGENLCKAEIAKLEPAPKSVRVDKEGAKASNASFVFDVKARDATNESIKLTCTVDRETDTATVALLSADTQQQASK